MAAQSTLTDDLTEDKKNVLITAYENPEATPKEIAEMIDDEHIKTAYVNRITADYSLPQEIIAQLNGGKEDEDEKESLTPEELEEKSRSRYFSSEDDETEDDETDEETDESEGRERKEVADKTVDDLLADATEKQLRTLIAIAAAPHPVTNAEITDAADVGQPYIYQANYFHEFNLVRKVKVEPTDTRTTKMWVPTPHGVEGLNRFLQDNPDRARNLFEKVPHVDDRGQWTGPRHNHIIESVEGATMEDIVSQSALRPLDPEAKSVEEEAEEAVEDVDVDEDEDEDEATEEDAEEPPVDVDDTSIDATEVDETERKELENISKEVVRHAFRCKLCDKGFNTHRAASLHIKNSEGPHKKRDGNEPGLIEIDQTFLREISPRSDGHNGTVSTNLELDGLFESDEDDEDEESTEVAVEAAPTGTDTTKGEVETTKRGNVTVTGSFDASSHPFQGIHERPVTGAPVVDEARQHVEDLTGGNEAETEAGSESTSEALIAAELTRDEVFGLLGSDAPESLRRRVFDALLDGGADE